MPATPTIYTADPTAFCEDDTALLQSDASASLRFLWFRDAAAIPSASSACAATATGVYTLRVQDAHQCLSPVSNALPVTVYRRPGNPALTAVGATSFCPGQSAVLNVAASGAQAYDWLRNGQPATVTTASSWRVFAAGLYSVVAHGEGDCP